MAEITAKLMKGDMELKQEKRKTPIKFPTKENNANLVKNAIDLYRDASITRDELVNIVSSKLVLSTSIKTYLENRFSDHILRMTEDIIKPVIRVIIEKGSNNISKEDLMLTCKTLYNNPDETDKIIEVIYNEF